MKVGSDKLIHELTDITKEVLSQAKMLKNLNEQVLTAQPAPDKWSALMCLEHLNRYGEFYLPEIKQRMDASTQNAETYFKSGLLGNYFAESMKPKEKLNKMNTFKSMNPINSKVDNTIIDTFISQQETMLDLLAAAREKSLTKIKTAISISKWIKLRLGDTLRVVIYHNQRHMIQALKATEVAQ